MRRPLLLLSGLAAIAGCALDPTGAAPTDGSTGATGGVGPGPASGATSTGPGASTASGAGGDPQGSGGGATSTSTGEGAGGGDGGAGGTGGAGGGDGGAGGAGGDGGAGGAAGFCGDGVVDATLGEECEPSDPLECDPVTCTWIGACGVTRAAPRVPGGYVTPGDTTVAPSTTAFGTCSDAGAAPVHVYEYTTGDLPSQVLAYVAQGGDQGLGDPILSIVAGCSDATPRTCVFEQGLFPCCVDGTAGLDEALVTETLPPGTTITVAVSGSMGDSGAYGFAIREYRYLLLETFEGGVGSFSAAGWSGVGPSANCSGGDRCVYVPDADDANAVLTSGPIDASDIGSATLGWWHRVDNSGSNPDDTQIVEVSTDGGATWDVVYTQGNGVDEFGVEKRVEIGALIAGEPDVRIRFVYSEGNGWFVDDVFIIAY